MGRVLLTGPPRVGKTTVLMRVARLLTEQGYLLAGFFTEEVRLDGDRVGFDLVPWSHPDQRVPFARVGLDSAVRVSRYGVDTEVLRTAGIPAIEAAGDLVLIDEIGGMELSFPGFVDAVDRLRTGERPWVATIQVHPHPYSDQLKTDLRADLVTVTPENRDELPADIVRRLLTS